MVSQTITVCWERYKAFCFSANQKSTRTCSFNCCNAFSILSYFAHLKVMNLILFLLAFLNVLNNMDWTITYFLLIPSTEPRTKARSELPNVPLVSPHAKIYTALPVSIVCSYSDQWVLSLRLYVILLLQAEPTDWVPWLPVLCQFICCFLSFPSGCD